MCLCQLLLLLLLLLGHLHPLLLLEQLQCCLLHGCLLSLLLVLDRRGPWAQMVLFWLGQIRFLKSLLKAKP